MKLSQFPRYIDRYVPYIESKILKEPQEYEVTLHLLMQDLINETRHMTHKDVLRVRAMIINVACSVHDDRDMDELATNVDKEDYIRDADEISYLEPITEIYLEGRKIELRRLRNYLISLKNDLEVSYTYSNHEQRIIDRDVTTIKIIHIDNLNAFSGEF